MKVTQKYEILAEFMNPDCPEKYHGLIIPFRVLSQWKDHQSLIHTGLFFDIGEDAWDVRRDVCEPVLTPGYNIGKWLTKATLVV